MSPGTRRFLATDGAQRTGPRAQRAPGAGTCRVFQPEVHPAAPASTRLLLTGLPPGADSSEPLRVSGCLLLPGCCCCRRHTPCWRRRSSFSRASSLSTCFSITLSCLSRKRKAAEKGLLSISPRPFSAQPLPSFCSGCFAPVVPAAASSRLCGAANTDCANVLAATPAPSSAGLGLFPGTRGSSTSLLEHRPLLEQAPLGLFLLLPPLPLSARQTLALLLQQPLSQARSVDHPRQFGSMF